MQVEAQSDQRQKNADQANRHVKQASLNLEDIKGIVFDSISRVSVFGLRPVRDLCCHPGT